MYEKPFTTEVYSISIQMDFIESVFIHLSEKNTPLRLLLKNVYILSAYLSGLRKLYARIVGRLSIGLTLFQALRHILKSRTYFTTNKEVYDIYYSQTFITVDSLRSRILYRSYNVRPIASPFAVFFALRRRC